MSQESIMRENKELKRKVADLYKENYEKQKTLILVRRMLLEINGVMELKEVLDVDH